MTQFYTGKLRFHLPEIRGVRFVDTAHGKHGEALGQHDDGLYGRVQAIGGRIEGVRGWYDGRRH